MRKRERERERERKRDGENDDGDDVWRGYLLFFFPLYLHCNAGRVIMRRNLRRRVRASKCDDLCGDVHFKTRLARR